MVEASLTSSWKQPPTKHEVCRLCSARLPFFCWGLSKANGVPLNFRTAASFAKLGSVHAHSHNPVTNNVSIKLRVGNFENAVSPTNTIEPHTCWARVGQLRMVTFQVTSGSPDQGLGMLGLVLSVQS